MTQAHSARLTLLKLFGANAIILSVAFLIAPSQTLFALNYFLARLTDYENPQLVFNLAMLGSCLLIEIPFMGWRNSALRKLLWPSRSAQHDVIVGAIQFSGFSWILMLFFTLGTVPTFSGYLGHLLGRDALRQIESPLLQFLFWFLAADFLNYCYHRLLHTFSFSWEVHKYHHAATDFTLLTGSRVHFLELAFNAVFVGVPLAALGTPIEAFMTIQMVRHTVGWFQHSMVDWTYGWLGKWVVFSPIGHRIHHSKMPEHFNKNFGDILTVWDHLFGTWYDGDLVNEQIGVSDNYFETEPLVAGMTRPVERCVGEFRRSWRTRRWLLRDRRADRE